jgi:hypothetical protein
MKKSFIRGEKEERNLKTNLIKWAKDQRVIQLKKA